MTQEELAETAGLSLRAVSDLERGIHRTARKDTALLLAGALGMTEPAAALFVAAARGRTPAADALAALWESEAAIRRQDQALAAPTLAVTVPPSSPAAAVPSDSRAPRASPVVVVPAQLPPAVAAFAGRKAELASLDALLPDAAGAGPGTVVISAVSGTAGVGKTTLAVQWAHRVAGRFGDGHPGNGAEDPQFEKGDGGVHVE